MQTLGGTSLPQGVHSGARRRCLCWLFTVLLFVSPHQAYAGLFTTLYRNEVPITGLAPLQAVQKEQPPKATKTAKKTKTAKTTDSPTKPEANPPTFTAPAGWFYEIAEDDGDTLVLRFDRESDSRRYDIPDVPADELVQPNQYYSIAKKQLQASSLRQVFVQGFEPGIMTVPLKFRFRTPDAPRVVSSDASVGGAFGFKYATDLLTTTIEPLLGVGLVQEAVEDSSSATTSTLTALTVAVGLQIDVKAHVAFGLMVGWDLAGGRMGRSWSYDGRPWLGLGLNAPLFSRSESQ